jgi:hypothetical protein
MTLLQMKRYFLSEKERETYERTILSKQPELKDTILEMDDEELLERLK